MIMGLKTKFSVLGVENKSTITWQLDEYPNDIQEITWYLNGEQIAPVFVDSTFSYPNVNNLSQINITATTTNPNYEIRQ